MSVNCGHSEDKKPVLNGRKLNGDLDAANWAILNVPAPTKSHQAIPKAFLGSVIPIGIIYMWSDDRIPPKWSLCNGENGKPLLPVKSIGTKKENYIPTLSPAHTRASCLAKCHSWQRA